MFKKLPREFVKRINMKLVSLVYVVYDITLGQGGHFDFNHSKTLTEQDENEVEHVRNIERKYGKSARGKNGSGSGGLGFGRDKDD